MAATISTSHGDPPSTSAAVRHAWGLFAALLLMMLGNGLLASTLGIRAEGEGFSGSAIGIIMAGYYVGFLAGSRVAVVVRRVGHVRVFAALASMASTAALVHAVFVNEFVWGGMRILFGFCQAGLYVVAESWLNSAATNENRGKMMSWYMVVLMGGAALGQLFLNVADPSSFELFVIASALVSLAVVPVSLSIGTAPSLIDLPKPLSTAEMWKRVPLGIAVSFGTGVASGAVFGMAAVYATRAGMSPGRVGIFVAAMSIGAIVFQFPIGIMSDRMLRRRAMFLVTMIAAGIAVLGTRVDPASWQILALIFVFGGFSFPMYSLVLSHINDYMPVGQAIAASMQVVFWNGVGAIAGPLLTVGAMGLLGNVGYFWILALIHSIMGFFIVARIIAKEPIAQSSQQPWRAIPIRSGVVLAALGRKRREDGSIERRLIPRNGESDRPADASDRSRTP